MGKNLDAEITDEELKKLFEPFGTVSMSEVKKDDKGVSRGFGFVVLSTQEEGEKAAKEMNDTEVKGKKLGVGAAERRAGDETGKGKGKDGKGGKQQMQVQQQQMYMQQMAYMQQYA